jgi:23S rRNA U2552 (ribose-2'-O)-methylase RlmE/FtsJ
MENAMVDRNGALAVRPGLRYLSYEDSPDMDPTDDAYPGLAYSLPLVGGQEPFYTLKGEKALLFGVREIDGTVGFRAILMTDPFRVVFGLEDPAIGFTIPQGTANMNFSEATTHVEYLQINNRIIAMSDAGEDIRVFFVGMEKVAKRMSNVSVPDWTDADKLTAIQPDAAWVATQTVTVRTNELLNPSFEIGTYLWTPSDTTRLSPGTPADPVSGTHVLHVESRPARTNMITRPLHDLATLPENSIINGWYPLEQFGHETRVITDHGYLRIYDMHVAEGPFLAYSAKAHENVVPGQKYRLAFDYTIGQDITPQARFTFHSVNGAKIGDDVVFELPEENGRWVSDAVPAPSGTVTIRAWVGGTGHGPVVTYVRIKDVVLCQDGEPTTLLTGASGTDCHWTGAVNQSASVYHPVQTVKVTSARVPVPKRALSGSASVRTMGQTFTIGMTTFNKYGNVVDIPTAGASPAAGAWFRAHAGSPMVGAGAVSAELSIEIPGVGYGQYIEVDAAMLESNTSLLGTYFDGSTAGTPITANNWMDRFSPHASPSRQRIMPGTSMPSPETPTANTLIATGGAAANEFKLGMFYTFENEIGESAPSRVLEIRMSRAWSNWRWETANAAGEPSGTATDVAELCADQLVVRLPQAVYEQALSEGAVKWHLYVLAWSDQDPVPVEGDRFTTTFMYDTELSDTLPYFEGGMVKLTPNRRIGTVSLPLPSLSNRVNYSTPPKSRSGMVASDRMVLVGDPTELATIKWTSNAFGEYTNFSAAAGGGEKTLTSGNLNLPVAVVLWQNPQSVDTLTILCQGEDGYSSAYYMQPATVQAASGVTAIMGFEETTNTPGTLSPYAVEVMNNGMYRPTMMGLLKSTAQNYNINHKMFSDKIANMWRGLQARQWMMSAQLDNRFYLLVNNPRGAALEEGCKGNEIWVLDIGAENGNWSRLLIQAAALREFDISGHTYMGVTRPEGLYYLDPDYRRDDYVTDIREVRSRPIPWRIMTNTQGANRAHDAWAHVQQVQITLGAFQGKMRYGVMGLDLHGKMVDVSKIMSDERRIFDTGYEWNVHDKLRIGRDLMEWEFYAESLDGEDGTGVLAVVQYRYTPVSVNVGTEFGSVETFEYGSNVANGPDGYAANGIPLTYMDYRRN